MRLYSSLDTFKNHSSSSKALLIMLKRMPNTVLVFSCLFYYVRSENKTLTQRKIINQVVNILCSLESVLNNQVILNCSRLNLVLFTISLKMFDCLWETDDGFHFCPLWQLWYNYCRAQLILKGLQCLLLKGSSSCFLFFYCTCFQGIS